MSEQQDPRFDPQEQLRALSDFHLTRDKGLDLYNSNDHPDTTYIVNPPHSAEALRDVTKLLDELLYKKRLTISRRQETSQGLIKRFRNDKTRLVESCALLTKSHFCGYRVDRDIEALLEVNESMGIGVLAGLPLHVSIDGKTVHEHYVEYLRRIRQRLSTREMRRYRRNLRIRSQRRINAIDAAVNDALSLCKRARLIRVDGNYRQSIRPSVTPERISSDLDRMIQNMRHNKRHFGALVLAVLKIEYGPQKGYHWHGYFIYDGDLVHKDILKGKYILNYWINVITRGDGSGFNVNSASAQHQLASRLGIHADHLAIGAFRGGDPIQKQNLDTLISYLGKDQQSLRVRQDRRIRSLRIVRGPGRVERRRNQPSDLHAAEANGTYVGRPGPGERARTSDASTCS